MPISIFNPPCPHADPVAGGLLEIHGQQPCGDCVCVARCYQITPVAAGPQDGYSASFMGLHVLTRNLAAYRTDYQERCRWDVSTYDSTAWGMILNTFLFSVLPAGWSLRYADSITGWILQAAGQSYLITAQQDIATYTLRAPGHAQSFFNCLDPTTFYLDSNYSNVNAFQGFPTSITVKPFWP